MKKNVCEKCGTVIEKNALFCQSCGQQIKKSDVKVTYDEKDNESFNITYEPKEHVNEQKKMRKKNSFLVPLLTFIFTLIISVGSCYIFFNYFIDIDERIVTKVEKDVTIVDNGIAEAVDKVYDAVVVVENYVDNKLYSTGTGFVYKTDSKYAYILTNHHVVDKASEVSVIFTDNQKLKATVVGSDQYSDIAVLSVESNENIKIATIGSSDKLKVGDTTFAVGAPLDSKTYSWTVTRGILSGKNRLVEVSLNNTLSSDYVMQVLQTDAAINSGNSGGPLCNSNGEVIGITNMKIASSSVEGMGFAIPIETASKYADKYINGEQVERPYLGVSMYDVTNRNSNEDGIYIESVEDNSPAYDAGLRRGDVITKINNIKVETTAYLKYELYKYNVKDKITITYLRDNKEKTTTVILGSYSQNS